ncbi:SGNH/GDSL hydrolase family protein [Aminipila terrae]|uniref:SGNH hydrolase-type esterase domain-containing protein n=1 Tax=Aminipila terrae TaxID=2697030 RepID=A0A6P1MI25_9FIRM|nr:SGNH/GDSL hydrolase family protein [Aminipila terrae]QHI73391.1 hypothetical protein Ami3637_14320 [Aminipila terrae]
MHEQIENTLKEAYQTIRFKTYQMGADFMENDAAKICCAFNFEPETVRCVLEELDKELQPHIEYLNQKYGDMIREKFRKKQLTICCLGDSFVSDYQSFFQMLRVLLKPYPNIKLIDAAVTSETSTQLITHIHKRAIVYKPDITFVLIGTNDMRQNNDIYAQPYVRLSEYRENLDFMSLLLHQCGSKVVLNTLPPYDTVRMEHSVSEKRWTYKLYIDKEYNDVIRDIALKHQFYLNDIAEHFKIFHEQINIPNNGLHLTASAHCYFADKLLDLLLNNILEC